MDLVQSAKLENKTFPNPYYLYFPIASTLAHMVVSMFDLVLLGFSVIGSFLGYLVTGFSLGLLLIGTSLAPSVIGSSLGSFLESLVIMSSLGSFLGSSLGSFLGSSVLVFWDAVYYQLHQQTQGFRNDFLF